LYSTTRCGRRARDLALCVEVSRASLESASATIVSGNKESQTALASFKNSGFETIRTLVSPKEGPSWPWPASSSRRGSASRRSLRCPPAPRRQEASEEMDEALASRVEGVATTGPHPRPPPSQDGALFPCRSVRQPGYLPYTSKAPRLCAPASQLVCLFAARTDAHACKLIRKACYERTLP
jgi:hypothetical protein